MRDTGEREREWGREVNVTIRNNSLEHDRGWFLVGRSLGHVHLSLPRLSLSFSSSQLQSLAALPPWVLTYYFFLSLGFSLSRFKFRYCDLELFDYD